MAAPSSSVSEGSFRPDESSLFGASPVFNRAPGEEPLPGYRLIAPLGRGGFGEVWKAEAPGGLHKAIKFIAPDPERSGSAGGNALRQEFEAFQHIKAIRHPFILQLERVELVAGELVMVMELADSQLQDRFNACRAGGLPGIPRDELLGYFADVCEALDVIGAKHGLQHLDIKPANLFVMAGHAKVGDYGLVARMEPGGVTGANRGLTPRYVAPEVLGGVIDPRSDQYSLALVYQELLTGTYPYRGKTAAQMMLQHVSGAPDLSGLPESDRPAVARALQKNPADRFPSCSEFVHALLSMTPPAPVVGTMTPAESPASLFRRTRVGRSTSIQVQARPPSAEVPTVPALPPLTVPVNPASTKSTSAKPPPGTPPPKRPGEVRIRKVHAVVAAARLTGASDEKGGYAPDEYVEALVTGAAGWEVPLEGAGVARLPDGAWGCRFPTDLLPAVVPYKLKVLVEEGWCHEISQTGPGQVVLRILAQPPGGRRSGRASVGAVVTVRLPVRGKDGSSSGRVYGQLAAGTAPGAAGPAGEVEVLGELVGDPGAEFERRATDGIPGLIAKVRHVLQTTDDRRKARRLPFDGPVTAYPLLPDGEILPAVAGRGRDVSAGGASWVLPAGLPTKYAYLEFGGIERIAGLAILTRVLRHQSAGADHVFAGRFRTDI